MPRNAISSISSQAVDQAARGLQKEALKQCLDFLRPSGQQLWVFVHLRSIALRRDGRCSIWRQLGVNGSAKAAQVEEALKLQYKLDPDRRTYNELLIAGGYRENFKQVSFGFGDASTDADIMFSEREVAAATFGYSFIDLKSAKNPKDVDDRRRRELAEARLSIGLNEKVREVFNLSSSELGNPLRALPDEVRYALQILMVWSNSLGWRYIETYHSRTRFDALTGLVITVCSRDERLGEKGVRGIQRLLESRDAELADLAKKKTQLLPRNWRGSQASLTEKFESRLTIFHDGHRLWDGRDVFHVLNRVRRILFAATFEGAPESYSLIFGHPGFISRPKELELARSFDLEKIREHRELCEGALDALNVVDVLGEPRSGASQMSIIPIRFPVWAKRWEDSEQAFGSSMEALSSVHQQMVVVGLMCRNVLMVYKGGELVCVFNGVWREVLPWWAVAEHLGIPRQIADNPRIGEIYRLLLRIAYGPFPRSVIVGFAVSIEAFRRLEGEMEPFGKDYKDWPALDDGSSIEPILMRATKADGAIIAYIDDETRLNVRSRARITSRVASGAVARASGTGDATAGAIARQGSEIVSMKVSRDGGMKVRWNGKNPMHVAIPMESD